jgi:pilus assembly protein CpaE
MPEIKVVTLAPDPAERAVLQMLVDGTGIAHTEHASSAYPVAATDPTLRRIHDLNPTVVIVDVPADNTMSALRAIELIHLEAPKTIIFAIGDTTHSQTIISMMRAGAREFLERPASTNSLLEAFVRLASTQRKAKGEFQRGRVFAFLNSKGGSGATTLAVNTALALQAAHGSVALVDLAPMGHAHLHLSMQSQFSVTDAMQNLHRMDESLLVGYMARHKNGLDLLAGVSDPAAAPPAVGAEFARLFDLLVGHYRHVVVDLSTRLDAATRTMCDLADAVLLVAQADVPSLWSATRVRDFLANGASSRDRIRLVLNRYRKMPGFGESEVEGTTGLKLFRTVPNQFPLVSSAIDRGIPVVQQNHSELAQYFGDFASALVSDEDTTRRRSWSLPNMFRSA